jgi:hypothetical protein
VQAPIPRRPRFGENIKISNFTLTESTPISPCCVQKRFGNWHQNGSLSAIRALRTGCTGRQSFRTRGGQWYKPLAVSAILPDTAIRQSRNLKTPRRVRTSPSPSLPHSQAPRSSASSSSMASPRKPSSLLPTKRPKQSPSTSLAAVSGHPILIPKDRASCAT